MSSVFGAIELGRREGGEFETIAHRYRLISSLGRCGVGERFVAEDEVTEERVLVLLLPASLASEQTRARLRRLDVSHGDERIVCPLAAGVDERGRPYTVTRWLDAEPLSLVLTRGIPRWATSFELLEGLCAMLAVAHERGLCHGCLEPARIFVGEGGPWLLDAGLATALARSSKEGDALPGSPEYVAPELLGGWTPSRPCDLYSLGVVLWELVSGAPPFVGELGAIVDGHRNRPLPELVRRTDAPVEVDALLSLALAKQPDERFNDTLELIETLRGIEASTSGVRSLFSLTAETPTAGSRLSLMTNLGALLRTFSVVELRATRDLIDKLLAARGK